MAGFPLTRTSHTPAFFAIGTKEATSHQSIRVPERLSRFFMRDVIDGPIISDWMESASSQFPQWAG